MGSSAVALTLVTALLVVAAIAPVALTAAQSGPSFDVASVKPNKSGDPSVSFHPLPGGRFTATNVPLRELIRVAYRLQADQIVGGPGWIASERFDIVASSTRPPSEINLMLRRLLADRFALVTHLETRPGSFYALVLARSDGRLGSRLRVSKTDCVALARARGRTGSGSAPPPPPPRLSPGERPSCGLFGPPGLIAAVSVPMAELARSLAGTLRAIVVDRTGLAGRYDFEVEWAPDFDTPRAPEAGPAPAMADGPALFTALEEQLGLKLEPVDAPVELLVIDSVQRPTAD